MKFKNTLILLIILIVFAAIVLIIEQPFENKSKKFREEAGLLFPELQTEQVKKLQIKKSDDTTITIKNQDDVWYVIGKEDYPADPHMIQEAVNTLQTLKKINLVSRKADKHALFEVQGKMGMEVILSGLEDKDIARLLIGKTGPDFFSTYIRRIDADEVYLYEGYLKGHFDRQVNNWRDKTIFAFNADDVTELKIVKKEETIVVSKDTEGNWQIEKPVSGLGEKSEVEKVLNTLSILKASNFADEEEKESGLADPEYKISVTLKEGAKTLSIGNKKGDHHYFAKSDEKKYLYLLFKNTVKTLTPSIKDLEKIEIDPEGDKESPPEKQEFSPPTLPGRR